MLRAARALFDHEWHGPAEPGWSDIKSGDKDSYIAAVVDVLAALEEVGALATKVEWGWAYTNEVTDKLARMALPTERTARAIVAGHPGSAVIQRRVGPWVEVPE